LCYGPALSVEDDNKVLLYLPVCIDLLFSFPRSPSPEPIYNSEGKRLNTREFRVRKSLEEERHVLIKQAVDEIPSYKPPIDYKPPASKICDKVFIPSERNPAVNFIGLLIGPRGNTLKRLEKETGCKIIIRGKGSVKEGKVGRIPGQLMPGEDEPLHALITGPTDAEVKKGVQVVGDIVKEGIECPDAANELRRNQLRELAELNGTLIDDEVVKCKNCGAVDHRHWECTERKNVTSEISCNKCGGYGHVAADCMVKVEHNSMPTQTFAEKAKMDTEYMSLMAELGVDAPPAPAKRVFQESAASGNNPSSANSSPAGNGALVLNRPNSIRPPNLLPAPPKESLLRSPSGPPKSLMDIDLGSASSGTTTKSFGGPRPDGPRGPRPDGMNRGPRPDGMNRGPRPDGMNRGPRPDGMNRGPRPDGMNRGMPPPWRNRSPMQGGPHSMRGAVPPWQQGAPHRGPPPLNSNFVPSSNSNFGPPSNSNFGPPQNSQLPPGSNVPPQMMQQFGFGLNQAPPAYGGLPAPWLNQPPPPPPPE